MNILYNVIPGETCTWLVIPALQTDLVPIRVDHKNIRRWFPAYIQNISQKNFMKIAEDALPKTGLSKFIYVYNYIGYASYYCYFIF